jgi:peptidoglycan hydrolase-like protein with peptidoglycan-binding domain
VEELSGQLWRLNNLGYRAGGGEAPAANDPDFLSAVEEFQCDYALTVDGVCGPATQAKLKDIHGS